MAERKTQPPGDPPRGTARGAAIAPSAAEAAVPWTRAQLRGITTTGHNILVSAAAGSGKTAMLAERCAHLVCAAPDPCDVDELLVVTFTEAAATQMKARIHDALRKHVSRSDSQRLHRQLALIDRASVSTLHSFCAKLLREHFHSVGLDPAFSVLDGEEAGLLRREVARTLFDERYAQDASGAFHRFIDAYGEGEDAALIRRVIDTHEMLGSLVDPRAWMDESRRRIDKAADKLEGSGLGNELREMLAGGITDLQARCVRAIEQVRRAGDFPQYVEVLSGCGRLLQHWARTLQTRGVDALADESGAADMPRLKPIPNATPGKDAAKSVLDSIRDAMSKGSWRDLLRFTSAQWQEGLRAIQPHAQVFLGLVEEFGKRYRAAKDAARTVDFADLERFTLDVLSEKRGGKIGPSPAARSYHKRFAHVLVDEYQDINQVQDAILSLLSRECVCDEPGRSGNLFSVGDVKQSIYRFRLAEAGRFLDRQKLFREDQGRRLGKVIDLQSNFRSRGPLLEAINAVFERLMTAEAADIEYDAAHRLQAGLSYPSSNGPSCFTGAPIELHLLPAELESGAGSDGPDAASGEATEDDDGVDLDRSEREALLAARRIRHIMGLDGSPPMQVMEKDGNGGLRPRPARFSDIVILLRSMRYKSGQYAAILRRCGIPVHAQSGTGYFDSMEIADMLALLEVLQNQRQDIPLAAVLRSPLANLAEPENCMVRIRMAYPAEGEEAVPFHDAVARYAQEKEDELAAGVADFLAQLARWRRLAHSRPLAELIWTIYRQSGYLAFCSGLHDGEQRVANLMDLHERAGQFGAFRRQGLGRFMEFLQGLRDETDLGQSSIACEADNVVRVLSIHRSKGQEFPVVLLPDLGKRINFSDCQGSILADRKAGLGLSVVDENKMVRYPSLASVLVQKRLKQQALAEELRVLYVAMTRAREHLILIGTCKAELPQAWKTRWSAQSGAFPSDMVLGARCMLDWLGPVSAASAGAGKPIFQIISHDAQDVASWQSAHARRPSLTPEQAALAQLRPIAPPPADNPAARRIIERLQFNYPFEPFTRLAAADAVTRRFGAHSQVRQEPADLRGPRFMDSQWAAVGNAGAAGASPAEIGTATHTVLLHLDFHRSCDAADLDDQIGAMAHRRIITAGEARMVDRAAIAWLAGSDIGALLRANASNLRRELPIHFAAPAEGTAESGDPLDRVMVRGRIDLLIPLPDGAVLLDYKTDAIPAQAVPRRALAYAPQLAQYRRAIGQIAGRPVARAHLVFITPRIVWTMPPDAGVPR